MLMEQVVVNYPPAKTTIQEDGGSTKRGRGPTWEGPRSSVSPLPALHRGKDQVDRGSKERGDGGKACASQDLGRVHPQHTLAAHLKQTRGGGPRPVRSAMISHVDLEEKGANGGSSRPVLSIRGELPRNGHAKNRLI
jgi:hypothetical protein